MTAAKTQFIVRVPSPRHYQCAGQDLCPLVQAVEELRGPCKWFASDVRSMPSQDLFAPDATGLAEIGSGAALEPTAAIVKQFLSGVFTATLTTREATFKRVPETEDSPFADVGSAVAEIRAFDTSYFSVHTADPDLARAIVDRFAKSKMEKGEVADNPA